MKEISKQLVLRLAKEIKKGPLFIPGKDEDYVRKLTGELKKYLHLAISSKKGTSYEPFQPEMDDPKLPAPQVREGHVLSLED